MSNEHWQLGARCGQYDWYVGYLVSHLITKVLMISQRSFPAAHPGQCVGLLVTEVMRIINIVFSVSCVRTPGHHDCLESECVKHFWVWATSSHSYNHLLSSSTNDHKLSEYISISNRVYTFKSFSMPHTIPWAGDIDRSYGNDDHQTILSISSCKLKYWEIRRIIIQSWESISIN